MRARLSAVIVACLTAGSTFAAEDAAPPAGPGPAEPAVQQPQRGPGTTYRVSAGATHQFDADLDSGADFGDEGSFSMTRYGLNAGVSYPIDRVMVDHNLTYEYDDYNFDSPVVFHRNLGATARTVTTPEPWDDSHLLSYSLRLSHRLNDDWSVFAGPSIGLVGESGADWSEAITYGADAGVRHQFSKDLGIGLGVVMVSGIEETQVFPLILLDWRISEKLHLQNGRPQPGLRGTAGAELAYEIAPRWTIAGGFAFDRRRFRLDDEGPAPDGIAQNSSFPAYLRASYELSDHWSFRAIAGVLLEGELRLEDEDGHQIGETDYDSAPFVGVSAAYTF